MGFTVCFSRVVGGTGRWSISVSTFLVALVLVLTLDSRALAADLTVTSGSSLKSATALPSNLPADATVKAENGWLSGLHVSGFLSQTFGMWQNSQGLKGFTTSRNSLATSRTWLQGDENYR